MSENTPARRASTGLWVRRHLAPKKLLEELQGLQLDTATLVSNAGIKPFHKNRWPVPHLAETMRALRGADIDPWVMVWPIATAIGIQELLADLGSVVGELRRLGVKDVAVELDCEGRHNSSGWGPDGARLAPRLAAGLCRLGIRRVSVTCIPPMRGPRSQDLAIILALLAVGIEVTVRVQGYSKEDPRVEWDDLLVFRPGVMQRHVLGQWAPLAEEHGFVLIMGLIGAFQDHPPGWPDFLEALQVAHDTATADERCAGVHVWDHNILASYAEAYLREAPFREPTLVYTPDDEPTDRADQVRELQRGLREAGYATGPVDGIIGPRTRNASKAYHRDKRGTAPDSFFDPELLKLIAELILSPKETS